MMISTMVKFLSNCLEYQQNDLKFDFGSLTFQSFSILIATFPFFSLSLVDFFLGLPLVVAGDAKQPRTRSWLIRKAFVFTVCALE